MALRIAVLGCGSIGRRHLANARILGNDDLIAFDPAPESRKNIEDVQGVTSVPTLQDLWERQPDVALIAAPSHLHTDLALAAVAHGCHLFVEKPLSYTLDRLDQLCAETATRNLVTMVACNMRFHPGPATMKRRIDAGAIGEILAMRFETGSYLPRWRPGQDYRQSYSASPQWGGATLDCIHEIDLALWFGGPATVAGAASMPAGAIGLETDGLAEIILRHESGALSSVHLNFVERDYRRACHMIGSEGTIAWDFNQRRIDLFGPDGERAESIAEPDGWTLNQMYLDELAHFLDAVRARRPTINPLEGGVAALRIALAARQQGAET